MGIRGIENLKGETMENEQQIPGQQQDESASPPPEQVDTPVSNPVEDTLDNTDDLGDRTVPEELQDHVHEGAVPPDNVDQEG